MSEKLRGKLRQLHDLSLYLTELQYLLGREVQKEELSSVDAAVKLRDLALLQLDNPVASPEIEFSLLSTKSFAEWIATLSRACPGPVALWTHRTSTCGFVLAPSLQAISFAFPYSLNSEGSISFIEEKGSARLKIDFWEESGVLLTQATTWGQWAQLSPFDGIPSTEAD
jgi:hypothetical protein